MFCRFAGKPNFAGADHRASVPITVDASARAATRKAKVVAKRSQVTSIRTLSIAAIDQIVGAKATARLVPPRQAAERGGHRVVVTEKIVLGRWRGPLRTAKGKFLNVALAAIPRISEIIGAYPAEHRAGALKVATRRYRRAAWDFGCTKEDSDGSVDAVMRTLQVQVEKHVIVQEKLTSLLHSLASPRPIGKIDNHSDSNEFEFAASHAPEGAGPNARAILPTAVVSHRKGQ